jgi:hypothetical protein
VHKRNRKAHLHLALQAKTKINSSKRNPLDQKLPKVERSLQVVVLHLVLVLQKIKIRKLQKNQHQKNPELLLRNVNHLNQARQVVALHHLLQVVALQVVLQVTPRQVVKRK